jgi:ABC-2 type transport system ATP-binding protein
MEKIRFWFKRLEMESWWNKKVEDLSKGMSQKLQFVATVLHEPKLIILDEPFSGLDPLNANLIKDEIYGLAQRGCTIIFSTHRMEQVEEICDHIVLVNMGQKILDGSVHNVKQQFKENKFSIKLHELPASAEGASFEVVDQKANALVVKIREGYRSNDVLRHFLDQQVTIESFHEILPSLNDIFIGLVEDTQAKTRAFQKV